MSVLARLLVAPFRLVRHYAPVTDPPPSSRPDVPPSGALVWLQGWYASQCDGDWEHHAGITIETIDNPGWTLRVDLSGTGLIGRPYNDAELHRSEHDWYFTRLNGTQFEGACGPLNLGEVIHTFRLWAQG